MNLKDVPLNEMFWAFCIMTVLSTSIVSITVGVIVTNDQVENRIFACYKHQSPEVVVECLKLIEFDNKDLTDADL